ncbi:MAG: hypothetical protein RSD27_00785, partial [Ruthenibacterium sp.]
MRKSSANDEVNNLPKKQMQDRAEEAQVRLEAEERENAVKNPEELRAQKRSAEIQKSAPAELSDISTAMLLGEARRRFVCSVQKNAARLWAAVVKGAKAAWAWTKKAALATA